MRSRISRKHFRLLLSHRDDDTANLEIRTCRYEDLDLLESAIPSPGPSRFHARRFAEQAAGRMAYLIAWQDGRPVGHVGVRWDGAEEDEVRARLPRCPMVNALGVWPPHLRRRGIGTALLAVAADLVKDRGYSRLGLGVAIGNERAEQLYRRLGYQEWGYGTVCSGWTSLDDDGRELHHVERVRILVKQL